MERGWSFLDFDAELRAAIPEFERARTGRFDVVLVNVASGDDLPAGTPPLGWLVTNGVVNRETQVGAQPTPELLGAGAVLPPAIERGDPLDYAITARAVTDASLVALGHGFARACGQWPQLLQVVQRRLARQHQRLAVQCAITSMARVEDRLLAMLWHLAGDFGSVTPDGTQLRLALNHAQLARFCAAKRSTITLAAQALEGAGLVCRADDRTWLLLGDPDVVLDEHLHLADPDAAIIGEGWAAQGREEQRRSAAQEARAHARSSASRASRPSR